MIFGWVEDPEPLVWPGELIYRRGEVVRINDVEVLAGRTGVVSGFDRFGEGRGYRYYLQIEGEPVSWVLSPEYLERTGDVSEESLPLRARPVLGEGTVVRLRDDDETVNGQLAFTDGLYTISDDDNPDGYSVRIAGRRDYLPMPFDGCEVVYGRPDAAFPGGWVDDPEPVSAWPEVAELERGEVVTIRAGALAGRSGTIAELVGFDDRGCPRYRVWIAGEPVMPTVRETELERTGRSGLAGLPPRIRPVLGDETVVRLGDVPETQRSGIAGRVALTAHLHWTPAGEPAGYAVRLPGESALHLVPFNAFTVVEGRLR